MGILFSGSPAGGGLVPAGGGGEPQRPARIAFRPRTLRTRAGPLCARRTSLYRASCAVRSGARRQLCGVATGSPGRAPTGGDRLSALWRKRTACSRRSDSDAGDVANRGGAGETARGVAAEGAPPTEGTALAAGPGSQLTARRRPAGRSRLSHARSRLRSVTPFAGVGSE